MKFATRVKQNDLSKNTDQNLFKYSFTRYANVLKMSLYFTKPFIFPRFFRSGKENAERQGGIL